MDAKKKPPLKAMLLSAGLGMRLRPLTERIPKPLLPVGGSAIIDYNLNLLRHGGITDIIINLHHLGDKIKAYVGDGSKFGLHVEYSYEPEILGTGGGVKNAEHFFENRPFIVLNSDILIDADIQKIVGQHFETAAIATMVVRRIQRGEEYTPVETDGRRVLSIGQRGGFMFTGLQVLEPIFLSFLPPVGFSCLVQNGYIPAIESRHIVSVFEHKGHWADIGTLARYEAIKKGKW